MNASRPPSSLALALAGLALIGGCTGTRTLKHPVVEIRTAAGSELGVTTEYGVVFLGRTARSGPVHVVAWFGDGPGLEASVIEPIGGGLYTAETDIRLPAAAMSFAVPKPGQRLIVSGRRGDRAWEDTVEVRSDPRVRGMLLSVPRRLRDAEDQVGAAVFLPAKDGKGRRLVGLVSGKLRLVGADGSTREYLTAVGPEELWRLATHAREFPNKRRWVYREDIL
jgi:hypothetical protein